MKIGIYSPYLDACGGGERYVLSVAEHWSQKHRVDVLLDAHLIKFNQGELKNRLQKKLNLNLEKINFIKAPLKTGNFLQRTLFLKQYDVIFYLTDGSIFYSPAKVNILHFQVPFINNFQNSLFAKIKLASWQKVVCNSCFTKNFIDKFWNLQDKTIVLYPPVDIDKFQSGKKENIILSVGRFVNVLGSKRQDMLLESFIKMYRNGLKGWRLFLMGGTEGKDIPFLNELKKKAQNYPVHIIADPDFEELKSVYSKSKIYWHAAGFGEDENKNPEKMEHFGITTVEAMASGCVPVIIKKGGQKEIVEEGINGFFWEDPKELIEKTLVLIKNVKIYDKLSQKAILRSQNFSKDKFNKRIDLLI